MQRNIKKYINILGTSRSENSKSSSFVINKMIHNHLTVALDTVALGTVALDTVALDTVALDTMHIMQYT